jgi:LEA14-like dessication related protein
MKIKLVYVLFFVFLFSCSGPKDPEFKRVENIKHVQKGKLEYTLTADIIMSNPNPISAKLMKTDLDIFVNDVKVGKVKQRLYTEVSANSEFTIPVKCEFSAAEILKNQNNSIGSLLNVLLDKKVDLQYVGSVKLKVAGLEFDVPVDYKQEIKLN